MWKLEGRDSDSTLLVLTVQVGNLLNLLVPSELL